MQKLTAVYLSALITLFGLLILNEHYVLALLRILIPIALTACAYSSIQYIKNFSQPHVKRTAHFGSNVLLVLPMLYSYKLGDPSHTVSIVALFLILALNTVFWVYQSKFNSIEFIELGEKVSTFSRLKKIFL